MTEAEAITTEKNEEKACSPLSSPIQKAKKIMFKKDYVLRKGMVIEL